MDCNIYATLVMHLSIPNFLLAFVIALDVVSHVSFRMPHKAATSLLSEFPLEFTLSQPGDLFKKQSNLCEFN